MFDEDLRSYLTDEDRQEIYAQAKAEGRAEGKAEGIPEGEAKGKAEVRADMAVALKKLGVPVGQISLASGLSPEEVEAL